MDCVDKLDLELNTSGKQQRSGAFDEMVMIGLAKPIVSIVKPTSN